MSICAFTAVCEEDAQWIPQYLAEVSRLKLDFAVHLDRCSNKTAQQIINHNRCIGFTLSREGEFDERHKQLVFNVVRLLKKYDWAMAWDIDETFEKAAPQKLANIDKWSVYDLLHVEWVNVWESSATIRIDGPFSGSYRAKFYNLRARRNWRFKSPLINGAYLSGQRAMEARSDIVCLHWGLMTHELRKMHYERWNRIYGKHTKDGKSPYKIWEYALNSEMFPPQTAPNPYI